MPTESPARRLAAALSALLLLTGFALPARAGPAETDAIAAVYADPAASGPRFSPSFLEAVSAARIATIVGDLRRRYGPALSVHEEAGGHVVETASHDIPVRIALDADGRIAGLLFRPARARAASIAEVLAAIDALPGHVSYVVRSGDETRFQRHAGERLAVGSAFKLGVLKALVDDIAAGRRRWEDVARLEEADRSLPSGALQLYPQGAPFTLHTLAAAMIANSDNTATDMLIRLLGAPRIAAALDLDALPTTRAFFTLKADAELAGRYRDRPAERGEILAEAAQRPLPEAVHANGPHMPGVEWYVDVRKLCDLALAVHTADVFTINPGPIAAGDWAGVAFKGGSEAGVLNLTAALTGRDGKKHCISVTVNSDPAVDEVKAAKLFAGLARQLAARKD